MCDDTLMQKATFTRHISPYGREPSRPGCLTSEISAAWGPSLCPDHELADKLLLLKGLPSAPQRLAERHRLRRLVFRCHQHSLVRSPPPTHSLWDAGESCAAGVWLEAMAALPGGFDQCNVGGLGAVLGILHCTASRMANPFT